METKEKKRSGYVRVVRKQNNTQHAPMAFVDGGFKFNSKKTII